MEPWSPLKSSAFIYLISLDCRQVDPNPSKWQSPSSTVAQELWCLPFINAKNKAWIPCHFKKQMTMFIKSKREVPVWLEDKTGQWKARLFQLSRELCGMPSEHPFPCHGHGHWVQFLPPQCCQKGDFGDWAIGYLQESDQSLNSTLTLTSSQFSNNLTSLSLCFFVFKQAWRWHHSVHLFLWGSQFSSCIRLWMPPFERDPAFLT